MPTSNAERGACDMKKNGHILRNVPLAVSAGAYLLLAVPATKTGLITCIVLTLACFALGFLLTDIRKYVQENTGSGCWCVSVVVCILMGLRFDNVWKLSGQVTALASYFNLNKSVLLTAIGCILALGAVYFVLAVLTFLMQWPKRLLAQYDTAGDKPSVSRRLKVGIAVLLIIQVSVLCYWGDQKQGFHVDEVYTFELSNYPDTIYGDGDNAYASWNSGDIFREILEPAKGHLFDLSVPFWNGETDNHPATYYILVNVVSSVFKLFGGNVGKWAGLIPNIVCCLITTVVMVLLLKDLLQNDTLALAGAAAWILSIGSINTGIYLRMYALVSMFSVMFVWQHLKLLSGRFQRKPVWRTLSVLQLITIAGILSQYYFLFLAFFLCGFVCLYLFLKKDWTMLGCYMLTEISAVGAAELLFPRMVVRLFFGDRGSEAINNLFIGNSYILQLQTVLNVLDQELFGGYGIPLMVVATCLLLVAAFLHRHNEAESKNGLFALLLMLAAGGYVLVVTKLAPYQVDRYYMCIFPLLWVYMVYGIANGILGLTKRSSILAIALAVALVSFSFASTNVGTVSYIYPENAERSEKLKQYGDVPVVALNGDTYNDSVLNWAFEFQQFDDVFLCRNNQISDIAIAAQAEKLDDDFILYVHQDLRDSEQIFLQIAQWLAVDSYAEIANTQGCRVFYCSTEQK